MRLDKILLKGFWSAIFLTILLLGSFVITMAIEENYLSAKEILIKGANYPERTNLTGALLVSMGKGEYKIQLRPLPNVNISAKVCCIDENNISLCKSLAQGTCNIECNTPSLAIIYNATVPAHQLAIAKVKVTKG